MWFGRILMNKRLLHSVRNAFISGLLTLAPLAVTWYVFSLLVEGVGGGFRRYFFFFVPESLLDHAALQIVWNVLATVIVLAMITGLGYLSRYFLGQFFGSLAERFIQSIPGVGAVYNTVKQIVDTFSTQNRTLFSKVVLVQFPHAGAYTVGFLTAKAAVVPPEHAAEDLWSVYVPTTPNPTSGFLLMLPKREIIELDMSVGEGMKLVISGGAVAPPASARDGPEPGAPPLPRPAPHPGQRPR